MNDHNLQAVMKPLLGMLLLIATTVILFYAKSFLMPLAYGIIFALLVNPIDNWLRNKGGNKYLTAMASVTLILLLVIVLLSALGWQIGELTDQSDQIKEELIEKQEQAQAFLKKQFGISLSQQEEYAGQSIERLQAQIGAFVGTAASAITLFLLSLVYSILFLAEKTRIKKFLIRLFEKEKRVRNTISATTELVQKYLAGKLIIIAALAVMYGIGFIIIGIQYAILLAILAALLTFIPFIGNIIGGVLAALVTLATGGSMMDILFLFVIITVAQLVENYILTPWIIGENINMNPLFTIVTVVALSSVWGAGGAVIALPIAAILKHIMSHVELYQPFAYLMDKEEKK